MAASFWMRSQMVQGRYMYLDCTQTKNVADNTSTIHWTLTVTGGSSSFYTTGPTQILIGGNLVYEAERVSYATGQFPAAKGSVSGTTTVKHDDVTGEATVAVTIYTMIYNGVQQTRTENWVLDPNPRFATLEAAPNFTDEENPTITYSNPALNNVTSLQACISLTGAKADIAYRDIPKDKTSYVFQLTEAERDVLRAATPEHNTVDVLFYLYTVIGGSTNYSVLRRTLTIKDPEPTIDPVITDSNDTTYALTGDRSKLIRFYSNAAVTIGAAAVKKATLASQRVTLGNQSLTANGTFSAVESNRFVFSAADSRGNTATRTVTPALISYVKLTCSLGDEQPSVDGAMTVKGSGRYYNGSFGAKSNSLKVYYRYKTAGGSYGSWTEMSVSLSGNAYSATAALTGLDYQTEYVVQAYAVDALATVYSSEKTVKATPVFDWSKSDFSVHVPVSIDGQLTAGGVTLSEHKIYVGGDLNTYYPVHVYTVNNTATPQLLFLKKDLGSDSPAWSGNHSSGTSSMAAGWLYRGGGWDGNGSYIDTLYKHEPYAQVISHIKMGTNSAYGVILWLRGGGASYRLASNLPITPTVYLSSTNIGNSTYPVNVDPLTSIGNGGVLYSNVSFLLDRVFPVNSIYIGYSHISPASYFGGTWSRITDRFLWAVSSAGTIGASGGEATVALTENTLPKHRHGIAAYRSSDGNGETYETYTALINTSTGTDTTSKYYGIATASIGSGAAHNNMPPFINVAIWRRVA